MSVQPKDLTVLRALADAGPMTVDHFVTTRGWYVNSWAPVFTGLRKSGLVTRTGDKRTTSHGAEAHVLDLTDTGRRALRG